MFRSVPMVHFRVQVPNSDAAAVTRCIAQAGLLHLVDIAHGRIAADGTPPGVRDLLAVFHDLAHRIRRVADRLEVPLPDPSGGLEQSDVTDFEQERQRLALRFEPLEASSESLWRRHVAATDRAARGRDARMRAQRLREAHIAVDRCTRLRFAVLRIGLARAEDLASLAALLSPASFAIIELGAEGGEILAAVSVAAAGRERLENALRVVPFATLELPADASAWTADAMEGEVRAAEAEAEDARARLAAARAEAAPILEDLWRRAEIGVLLLQAQTFFAAAGRFVVISGWIPEPDAEQMRRAILTTTGQRALVDVEKPEDLPEVSSGALRVPILHRNPILLRPFQSLVQLYGTPSYQEIEPTAFFAVSFLLMFGLMFGDLGHGLVLFSAGYLLFRQMPRFLDYGILLMEGGAASMTFGVLYGSCFGIEGLLPVLWMEPVRDLPRFMVIAVGLGAVLVTGGLLLNVINTWRAGEKLHALFSARGLSGAFAYWVVLALVARAVMPRAFVVPTWALLALLAVAVVLLLLEPTLVRWFDRGPSGRTARAQGTPRWLMALEGSVELVDVLFSYFANTISFVRVAAFAAVHAGIFIALFALADTLARLRFGGPLAVLSLVAGNIVMIFLEGLTVSVQVLRLVYYEFFSKFFRGGGEPYRPLMLRGSTGKGETG